MTSTPSDKQKVLSPTQSQDSSSGSSLNGSSGEAQRVTSTIRPHKRRPAQPTDRHEQAGDPQSEPLSAAAHLSSEAPGSNDGQQSSPGSKRRRYWRSRKGSSPVSVHGADTGNALSSPSEADTVQDEVLPGDQALKSNTDRTTGIGKSRMRSADSTKDVSFMHPSEREFAKLLDFYNIKYLYEPRSFPLRWDGHRVVEMFSPDFYLPEQDQYFELTTMKQSLVTQKNRKLRHTRELYPEVNIQLLYRRDIMRLLAKYGYGPLAEAETKGVKRTLFTADQIQRRVQELGSLITQEYQSCEIVLVGVLRGVITFMADLMRSIDLPLTIDFMEVSHYGTDGGDEVSVTKDVAVNLTGKAVILVEDIVDTGMTLRFLLHHLWAKQPSSVAICTLLDKQVRRMNEIPLQYVGFEIPDEFVVGYGLDFQGLYRNLPYVGVLETAEPKPAVDQQEQSLLQSAAPTWPPDS